MFGNILCMQICKICKTKLTAVGCTHCSREEALCNVFFHHPVFFFFKHLCLFQDNLWFPLDREGGGWMGQSDSPEVCLKLCEEPPGEWWNCFPQSTWVQHTGIPFHWGGTVLGLVELGPSGGAVGEQSRPWAAPRTRRDSSISHQHTELNFLSWIWRLGEEDSFATSI